MKSRRRKSKTQPTPQAAECLESRQLLTGNLEVELVGGQLNIQEPQERPDRSEVEIQNTGNNLLLVWGKNGTTINGRDYQYFSTSDVDRIFADLGSGNDTLRVNTDPNSRPLLIDSLTIDMGSDGPQGSDEDVVEINNVLAGELSIATEGLHADDDYVKLTRVNIFEDLTITTGDEDDRVEIDEESRVGDLTIDTDASHNPLDSGNDVVILDGLVASGDILVRTTGDNPDVDNDFVQIDNLTSEANLEVELGPGLDQLYASGINLAGDMDVDGGIGNEFIDADDLTIGGNLFMRTSFGDDHVELENAKVDGWLMIETGHDEDTVEVRRSSGWLVYIHTGERDDDVTLDRVFAYYLNVDGGDGDDDLTVNRAIGAKRSSIRSF